MKRRPTLRLFGGIALVLVGALIASYPFLTDLRYTLAQQSLASDVLAGTTGEAMPGKAVARLVIPRIGLDAFVLEGTSAEVLDKAPGHYPATPMPGTGGNSCVAGHRTMYGHPFRRLDELKAGDQVVASTSARTTRYTVVSVTVVPPTQVEVAAPTATERLTLTTCNPVGSAAQRLVVVCAPVR